jgi:predicted HTH domain antitoxin
MEDKLLTVAQASELAGVSTESIRRLLMDMIKSA